jgi:hypothetical protein
LPVSNVSPPKPTPTQCVCEDVICILSFPEGCYCRNNATKACFDKCGGVEPEYQNCSIDDVQARAPKPEPAPEPESEAKACVCAPGPLFCPQVWPQSCYCEYNAKKACSDKCGGPAPPLPNCPPLTPIDIKARVAEPKSVPAPATPPPKCECPLVKCIASWPETCYCQNAAKERCYQQCGGKKPVLQVRIYPTCTIPGSILTACQICPPKTPSTLSTSTTTITPIPLPTPVHPPKGSPTNQICGGGRASAVLDCPVGQVCITDPFQPGSCGPACDQLGICVGEKLCGGFAGFKCDNPGQVCVDDPRDDCDPLNGGSDCGGLCAWPQ